MRTAFAPTPTGFGPQAFDPAIIAADAVGLLREVESHPSSSGAWHVLAAAALHPGSFDM